MKSIRGALCGLLVAALLAPPAWAETVEQRLERMEKEIQDLREELRRERAEKTSAPAVATPAPAASAAPAPGAAPPTAVAGTPAPEAKGGLASRAYDTIIDRVKIGGYGSTRLETSTLKDQSTTFTYRRFVLSADAAIAPRMRSYLELEFERFRELELEKQFGPSEEGGLEAKQAIEGTNQSEISFEQA